MRLGAAVALCLSLLACKSKPVAEELRASAAWLKGELPAEVNDGKPREGGTLTVRIPLEPSGLTALHDQMAEGWMKRYTLRTVYETLAELDPDSQPAYGLKPLLAERWEDSADHLAQTVHLRHGVRFHDGQPFTSRDVEAVLGVVMNPANQTRTYRSFFTDLAGFDRIDDFTFVIRWKRPYFLAFRNFATALPMMPAAALKGPFDGLSIHRSPIGTGPFQFVSWEPNRAVTLVRSPTYWGPAAHLERVVLRFVKDATVATQLWEAGEFDLMTMIDPAVWRGLEVPAAQNRWAVAGYHRIRFVENNYSWLGWNERRPVFQDRKVRTALAMLFPAEAVARTIDLGLEPPTTCPYAPGSSSCDPEVKPLPHDLAIAQALLTESGWVDRDGDGVREREGQPLRFTFLANASSVRLAKLLPLLQQEYRKAGVEMEIERVETAVFFQRLRAHDFDACSLLWQSVDPEQDNFQIFHSSQAEGGSNYVSYANPEADRLMEQLRTRFDSKERAGLERALHRLLYRDQVYDFLSRRPLLDAVSKRVHGIAPALTWYDLRKVWIE